MAYDLSCLDRETKEKLTMKLSNYSSMSNEMMVYKWKSNNLEKLINKEIKKKGKWDKNKGWVFFFIGFTTAILSVWGAGQLQR